MKIENFMEYLKNPVKSQVLFCLRKHKSLTEKELLNFNTFISQASLYRTLKKMEEDNVIIVIKTEKSVVLL